MSKKIALTGLKAGYIHQVAENTEAAYKTGEAKRLIGLQSLSKEDEKDDFDIPADDEIYATGSDFKYTNLELVVAQLDNEMEAYMSGGTFSKQDNVYVAKSMDIAPEIALCYAAANISGGYRLFRHPVCKVISITVEHKTKGDGTEVASYTLALRGTARKIDGATREQKDVDTADFTWLKTLEQLPVTGQ